MTLDLASLSDFYVFLDLHKIADPGFIPDFAPIKVNEIINLDVFTQFHIRRNPIHLCHSLISILL